MGRMATLYRPPRKRGRKPSPPESRRRHCIKVWLTEAEFAAVKTLDNISATGRASLLAAAKGNQT